MSGLAQIGSLIPAEWLPVYLRIQACILAMPVFSERYLPVRVRVALAMALVPLFAPLAAAGNTGLLDLGAELTLGLMIGLLVRLFYVSINIAATAMAMSASLSQLFGTGAEASPHPIGNFLHLAAMAVVLALGFPIFVADLIAQSFALWPGGSFPLAAEIVPEAITLTARSFSLALVLAAPFILGGLLYQAGLGVINKVMPTLPVVLIGSPAAILLALIALAILAPAIVRVWSDALLSLSLPGTAA